MQRLQYKEQIEFSIKNNILSGYTSLIAHRKIDNLGNKEPEFVPIPMNVAKPTEAEK